MTEKQNNELPLCLTIKYDRKLIEWILKEIPDTVLQIMLNNHQVLYYCPGINTITLEDQSIIIEQGKMMYTYYEMIPFKYTDIMGIDLLVDAPIQLSDYLNNY